MEIDKPKRPVFHNSFGNKETQRKHKSQINELKHQGIRKSILLLHKAQLLVITKKENINRT